MPARINAIASAMPDETAADAFLADVLLVNASGNPFGGLYSFAITGMSSAEAWLNLFRQIKEKNLHLEFQCITDEQAQTWGVTREQISEIFGE